MSSITTSVQTICPSQLNTLDAGRKVLARRRSTSSFNVETPGRKVLARRRRLTYPQKLKRLGIQVEKPKSMVSDMEVKRKPVSTTVENLPFLTSTPLQTTKTSSCSWVSPRNQSNEHLLTSISPIVVNLSFLPITPLQFANKFTCPSEVSSKPINESSVPEPYIDLPPCEDDEPIEKCLRCYKRVVPKQFNVNGVTVVMKTICDCGLPINIAPKPTLCKPNLVSHKRKRNQINMKFKCLRL